MLLAKSTGGIGTHVDDLTRELRNLGHDVVLATDPLTASAFGWEDAELVWPGGRAGGRGPVVARRRRITRLRDLMRSADVVHAHGHQAGSLAALVVRAVPRRHRPALAVSLHNAVLGGPRRQRLGALTAKPFATTAALVTGASSDLVDQSRAWGAGWAELAPVPSPLVPGLLGQESLDRGARRELAGTLLGAAGVAAPAGADLVLTVARIAPQKDLPTLVEAAAFGGADRTDATGRTGTVTGGERVWVVIGGGDAELAARLSQQARDLGAPLHFIGPQRDPAPWLRAASVFVLTSHWEARALVVQEALAAGTPVVARDAGGLRDLVAGVGVLIDTSDPARWGDAVGRVLTDDEAWDAASAAGRKRAAQWDDSRSTATRWVSWYARARAMT